MKSRVPTTRNRLSLHHHLSLKRALSLERRGNVNGYQSKYDATVSNKIELKQTENFKSGIALQNGIHLSVHLLAQLWIIVMD
jgi:hypothetical protein